MQFLIRKSTRKSKLDSRQDLWSPMKIAKTTKITKFCKPIYEMRKYKLGSRRALNEAYITKAYLYNKG